MARHLLGAGHDVTVWNRTISKAEELRNAGAKVGKSAGDTVEGVEVFVTMLADDRAVESAVFSECTLDHLPRNAVHISMSTISVALSNKLADEHSKRKHHYIAAPVFGRPAATSRKWQTWSS